MPPDAGPDAGETALTVGAGTSGVGELIGGAGGARPPRAGHRHSTVPDPAGEVAVIDVAEFTTTPVAALPPKATVSPAAKFVP